MQYGHRARRNPTGWRWRLVHLLTGGELEVVPLLPLRAIHEREVLVVKLGDEDSLNTVEVRSMAPETNELIPMGDWYADPQPNTIIAVDIPGGRVVGTFIRWEGDGDRRHMIILRAGDEKPTQIAARAINRAYWAPAGYRP